MYKGFNIIKNSQDDLLEIKNKINKEELEKLLNQKIEIINPNMINNCYEKIIENDKAKVDKQLEDFTEIDENGVEYINISKIKEIYFPILDNYDIFVSHSHNDLDYAKQLAVLFYCDYELKVFIDAPIWEYCDKLIRLIDNKYCVKKYKNNKPDLYDYQKRNITTSHVHMVLSNALMQMIDKCKYFFFINTENSIIPEIKSEECVEKTKSPWIYNEIMITKLIQKKPVPFNFGEEDLSINEQENVNMIHEIDLEHLFKIDLSDLLNFVDRNDLFDKLNRCKS